MSGTARMRRRASRHTFVAERVREPSRMSFGEGWRPEWSPGSGKRDRSSIRAGGRFLRRIREVVQSLNRRRHQPTNSHHGTGAFCDNLQVTEMTTSTAHPDSQPAIAPPPDGDRRQARRELRRAVHRHRKSRQPHDDRPGPARDRGRRRCGRPFGRRAHSTRGGSWRRTIADGCSRRSPTPSKRSSSPIARTVALETGNAIRTQARSEVKSAVDVLRYFGGVASELKGETVPAR